LYQSLIPTQWNVDRGLNRFVQDPKGLRSQMGIHNALISGSFVVQFFDRVVWKEADLDVFVEGDFGASAMELYLCSKEGYRFIHEGTNEQYVNMKDVLRVSIADRTIVLFARSSLTMSCRSERSQCRGHTRPRLKYNCRDGQAATPRNHERFLYYTCF